MERWDINVYQVLSTQQKDCTETPQAGFIIVVFCAVNLQPCGRTHIPAPREMCQLCSAQEENSPVRATSGRGICLYVCGGEGG